MVILIVGRWLLPKGRITRDELSQLLLAYLAISADIVELFNLFQEREVRMEIQLSLMVLAFWTVSLVQFPFVITTVKSQKARFCFNAPTDPLLSPINHQNVEAADTGGEVDMPDKRSKCRKICDKVFDVRVWGILSTILLQDLPFWVLRIYLIAWRHIMSYTMFFFICKNSLIMWVQIYRLVIICGEKQEQQTPAADKRNPPQLHLLHPQYYSPFSSPEKRTSMSGGEDGQKEKEKEVNLRLLNETIDEEKKPEQNGSSGYDPRRPSLNITGSVSARDLVAQNKNRRNALIDPRRSSILRKKKNQENEAKKDAAANVVMPQIKLATPDTPDDL